MHLKSLNNYCLGIPRYSQGSLEIPTRKYQNYLILAYTEDKIYELFIIFWGFSRFDLTVMNPSEDENKVPKFIWNYIKVVVVVVSKL